MAALLAVILFAVALILRLLHESPDLAGTLVVAGLCALAAAHLALPDRWVRRP
jgi:hypothetical protein